jgi:hypothetical protein
MISTKDLDYLSDMMNWNFVLSKKVYHFANETSDKEIRTMLSRISNMHHDHYNMLLDLLNEGRAK